MSALSDLQTTIQSSLSTLSGRERRLIAIAVGGFVTLLVFFIVFSSGNQADSIRRRTSQKMQQLSEIQTLAQDYGNAKASRDAALRELAASNVRLRTYLDEKAQQVGIELPSINPRADVTLEGSKIQESSVDLMINDVKIDRLTDFISQVEAGPGVVKVTQLSLEPHPQAENVSARITISTYHLKN